MQFRHLHIKNFLWLVPAWIGVDRMQLARILDDRLRGRLGNFKITARLPFLTAIFVAHKHVEFLPSSTTNDHPCNGSVAVVATTPFGAPYTAYFTLNFILRECPSIVGQHVVYSHAVTSLDTPLAYIGITKQPWADRFGQHINAARNGSPFLFHDAIRRHASEAWSTIVLDHGLDHDEAMTVEEARVARISLYPLGLNMIPGGYAGIRYLHRLGVLAKNAEERDSALERLSTQPAINGRANPLCAARWASDQDYINRVICGRSDRLSVEQIRAIRLHSSFGLTAQEITEAFGLSKPHRVARASLGKTYSRVQ